LALIQLRKINRIFHQGDLEIQVLKDIDLDINEGDFVAIMGASGSGKSTLMYIIGCLDSPSSGSYHLKGVNVSDMDDDHLSLVRNESLGFIFQSFYLIPYLNVMENVLIPTLYSSKNMDFKKRASDLLEEVDMAERMKFLPSELSGGQKQRVAIVRSLINDPEIVLADEPTGQLDSRSSGQVMEILSRLNSRGKTIILVTHDPETARYAKRTIFLKDGRISPQ
jgi:putative ABC transport system ATP-binding protein